MLARTLNLSPGQRYELRNTATGQTAQFEILEAFWYKGHYLVYGEKMRQGLWFPATTGRVQVPPGPACFPIIVEAAEDIMALVEQLRSLPLYLVLPDHAQALPLLSLEDSHLILGGERGKKDHMIQRAQRLIDLYLEWLPTRTLPTWFRLKQGVVKTRN